jgi:DNA-binding MurR/RpiR family transcriptional regulator
VPVQGGDADSPTGARPSAPTAAEPSVATPGQPAEDPPVLARVRALAGHASPAEGRVAAHVLAAPADVAASTIEDLARACGVSETTVVRFCRAAGASGYREFRLSLVAELARGGDRPPPRPPGDLDLDDPLEQVVTKLAYAEARAIEDTVVNLDTEVLRAVVDAVAAAPRVELVGIGASALVAQDLWQKLRRIGRTVAVSTDPHAALAATTLLTPGDVAIGVSSSGATVDTLEPIRHAADRGATTIAITDVARSPLARGATHVLTTATHESAFRSGAMASRSAQLLVTDAIYVGVLQNTAEVSLPALERTHAALRDRRPVPQTRRHQR